MSNIHRNRHRKMQHQEYRLKELGDLPWLLHKERGRQRNTDRNTHTKLKESNVEKVFSMHTYTITKETTAVLVHSQNFECNRIKILLGVKEWDRTIKLAEFSYPQSV